jgi:hypothetical protein
MYPPDMFAAVPLMQMRVEEELRKAEMNRLLHKAGIQPLGWFSRQGCWLLCQLGRLLEAVGQTLQRRFEAQRLTPEKQAT